MKGFRLVFSLCIKNLITDWKSKKMSVKISSAVIIGLLFVAITISIDFLFQAIAPTIVASGYTDVVYMMILTVACIPVLLFGTFYAISTLYFSKDNEFFMQLPVRTSTVFLAKLLTVYVVESALFFFVSFTPLMILGGRTSSGAAYFINTLLLLPLMPAFPIVIISLLSLPFISIARLFKNRSLAGTIISLLFFLLFMGAYMYLCFGLGAMTATITPDIISEVFDAVAGSFRILMYVFFPLGCLAKSATMVPSFSLNAGMSSFVNFILCLASMLLLFGLSAVLSSFLYRKNANAMNERGSTSKSKNNVAYNKGSSFSAIAKLEFWSVIRDSSVALQCFTGTLMLLIMPALLGGIMKSQAGSDELSSLPSIMVFSMMTMFTAISSIGSGTCMSREGKKLALFRTLPVDGKSLFTPKIFLWIVAQTACGLVGVIIYQIIMPDWVTAITMILLIPSSTYAFCYLGAFLDSKFPKVNWINPVEAVKRGTSVMILSLVGVGVFIISVVICSVVMVFAPNLIALPQGIIVALMLILGVIFHYIFNHTINASFEQACQKIQ